MSKENEKIRQRVIKNYAAFAADVDPDLLSDHLKQEGVISIEQWQDICGKNTAPRPRCRALLDFLLTGNNPIAFLVVRRVLEKENHYLLDVIDENDSSCVTEDKLKIEKLETELYNERRKTADLIEDRRRLQVELEEQKCKCDELKNQLEIIQTQQSTSHSSLVPSPEQSDTINPENRVYYKDDPVLVKTIKTKAAEDNKKGISGLAIADAELFITSFKTNDVEVYDLKSLDLNRIWKLHFLINPWDLGYCKVNKCLYVMDATGIDANKCVIRVDLNGKSQNNWSTRMVCGCISVTYDCNVVVVAYQSYSVTEYTADGWIVREITLSTLAGFARPWHAIKLTNDRFLVSHGEGDDSLHRVCVVDASGDIRKSIGGRSGSTSDRLTVPIYLVIDSNGGIIVADRDNSRVLLLSSGLVFKREIISSGKEGMHRPERMVLDEANGRLLVAHNDASWNKSRVFVFEIL